MLTEIVWKAKYQNLKQKYHWSTILFVYNKCLFEKLGFKCLRFFTVVYREIFHTYSQFKSGRKGSLVTFHRLYLHSSYSENNWQDEKNQSTDGSWLFLEGYEHIKNFIKNKTWRNEEYVLSWIVLNSLNFKLNVLNRTVPLYGLCDSLLRKKWFK